MISRYSRTLIVSTLPADIDCEDWLAKNETSEKTQERCMLFPYLPWTESHISGADKDFARLIHDIRDIKDNADTFRCNCALEPFDEQCLSGMDPWRAAVSIFETEMNAIETTAIGMSPYVPRWRQSQSFLFRSKDSLASIANTAISPMKSAKQCLVIFLKKYQTQQAAHHLEESIIISASRNVDTEDKAHEELPKACLTALQVLGSSTMSFARNYLSWKRTFREL